MVLRSEEQRLPCQLTNDELLAKGDALATTLEAIETEEGEQRKQRAEMKERLVALETLVGQLQREIQERREFRAVPVDVVIKDRLQGLVAEIRRDTGEVLCERFMTDDERQLKLPEVH